MAAPFTPADTIVLATRNLGKIRELEEPLKAFGLRVVGLHAFPNLPEIAETGKSFAENSLLKASKVCELTGLTAIADDSGLEVDALHGAPGIYSARYSDDMPGLPAANRDERNILKLLAALAAIPLGQRQARFHCVITACTPDGRTLTTTGTWEGQIALAPSGKNGFGYDPVFFDPTLGRTAAQLTPALKSARSHRGQALRKLLSQWPAFWANQKK